MKFGFFLITIVSCLAACTNPFAKKVSEGKATFSITYISPGNERQPKIETKEVIYFKDSLQRIQTDFLDGKMDVIVNPRTKMNYTLFANATSKAGITGFIENPDDTMPTMHTTVKLVEGKKKIAGYDCKKALVETIVGNKKLIMEVWYTDAIIPGAFDMPDKNTNIPGFVMELISHSQTSDVAAICTSFETTPIADDFFDLPKEYKIDDSLKSILNLVHTKW